MTEWREAVLRDIGSVQSGFAFKSSDWVEAGVPVVKIQNVRDGRVNLEGCSLVSNEVAEAAARYRLSKGDVLVTMSGEIGSVGVVRSDRHIMLNQRVGRVRLHVDDPLLLRFLGYALQLPAIKATMELMAYGAAQANISPTLLASLPIVVPSEGQQRAITDALGAIDDLIENSRRRVDLLAQMAQAIYREWFVRFRYPGHEDATLVDSSLGPIPRGWAVKTFADIASFVNGFAFNPEHWGHDGRPIIKIKELKQGVTPDTPRCDAGKLAPKYWVEPGDLLFSWSADLGAYRWSYEPGLLNQHLFTVIPAPALSLAFLFRTLHEAMPQFRDRAQGTTMRHIKRAALSEVSTIVPPQSLIERFTDIAEPIDQQVISLRGASGQLAAIRDLLLPKLVTGQIDISNLELDALADSVA